jgi:hypothetical protein
MDKLRFHHLCLAIGGLDSIILNLVKIRWNQNTKDTN